MPGVHRDFLADVDQLPSLRLFVEARETDAELVSSYNDCIRFLKSWRKKHIAIVSRYIVQPARRAEAIAQKDEIVTVDAATTDGQSELRGSGGTELLPFLRQANDDTRPFS